jgi:hypothetical protein
MASIPIRLSTTDTHFKKVVPVLPEYFHWVTTFFGLWFLFGLYLDGWAHSTNQVDTFFTPWHLVLYSGLFGAAIWMHANYTRYLLKGFSVLHALPKAYLISMVGCWIFLAGGGFDFLWHSWFGFERDLETLLSPAHLLLATGGALYSTGPIRAALAHRDWQGWRKLFPAFCGVLSIVSVISFFAMYAHILGNLSILIEFPEGNNKFFVDTFGVFEVTLPVCLMSMALLFMMRVWHKLPVGTFAFIFGINSLMVLLMRVRFTWDYPILWLATFVTILLIEGLFQVLRPSAERLPALRLFFLCWPLLWLLILFGAQQTFYQMWWSIHLWLGAAISTSLLSLLSSYVVFPPDVIPESTA